MERLSVVYSNIVIGSESGSLVIVRPKVPISEEESEESEEFSPYEVHEVEDITILEESISDPEPVPVIAEVDVSSLQSVILCAVIVICCFVSILRD